VWSEHKVAQWEETRGRGIFRFILIHGILGWGGSLAVIISIVRAVSDPRFRTFDMVWPNFVMFPIFGVFYAVMMWVLSEQKYRSYQDEVGGHDDHRS